MKLLKIALAGSLILSFSATTLLADATKGQKLFVKKYKNDCGFAGDKFAAKHSQDEWEEIMEAGKFKEELLKICPKVKEADVKDKYIQHLYDFSYKFANDSGNVPSC
ncbi:cytochrome C [Poseidonibacter lekithochrous]|uniref:cytochrome C n=1 Tax=Poseidonibacter TaxID=2321187 RepID=UPI001C0974D5|nr:MULTISPECIES: cytochrome C [Poseidonibacter]MBU3014466.1 cytochrome C [Poseidonibacter lekithochrous]MDO6827764.1 cytochrome C [Poseidonibacter sp. 1_MG-2023]